MDGDLSHAESRRGGEFFSRKERIDRKGWKRVRLGDVGHFVAGSAFPLQYQGVINAELPFCKVSDFSIDGNQDTISKSQNYITNKTAQELGVQIIPRDSIIFAKIGAAINLERKRLTGRAICIDNNMMAFIPDNIHPRFACYFLQTVKFASLIEATALPSLSAKSLVDIQIPLPTSEEQIAVAMALSTIDAHISALSTLIAKYEAIKKATVNLLLKPKAGWRQITMSDIGDVLMCKRILKNQTTETGDVPFYKIGTFGKTPDSFISRSLFEDFKAKFSYPNKGDVLLSAAGTIGRTVVFNGEDAYFQDSNIVWIDNNESIVTNRFLNVLYGQMDWQTENGGTVSRLYNANIRNTRISIPTLTEQKRIVGILDSIDGTINGLKSQLAKAKDIKQGMMSYFFG